MHRLSPRSLGLSLLVAACAAVAACGGSGEHPATAAAPKAAPKAAAPVDMVVVPQLIGRRQDEAHRILARAGLQMRWTGFVGKYGNGRYNIGCVQVLRQSPVAGEKRPRGASIAVIEAACRTPNQHPHGVTSGGQPEA
jgi:beta-lactam-binding protein with PASTA domain